MHILLVVLGVLFGLFAFVILFGAPYLPTHKLREQDVLDLLDLKPGQTLLELGSGDGRILRLAAERGIRVIGYELNPLLVIYSRLQTWKYRHLVSVRMANYWHGKLPPTDGIYVFLLDRYMDKLNKKIEQEFNMPVNPVGTRAGKPARNGSASALPGSDGVKLVSYAFSIKGKKPSQEKNGMYLYVYK